MLWASTAINALLTRGIWPAGKAARIAIATPTIPLALPAMRLWASALVNLDLVAEPAESVENCSGGTLKSNATHATVTQEALRNNSATRPLVTVFAWRAFLDHDVTRVLEVTLASFHSVSAATSALPNGI